ncbi:MAG: Holliday junction resolvase RuvX [Pseudomonadales bacterium]
MLATVETSSNRPDILTSSPLTLLCFDFGTKKIGAAVGQTVTFTASALPIIRAENGEPDWQSLDQLVSQWKPGAILVGMPYNMDGSENEMTSKTQSFIKKLIKRFDLPCHTIDERLSTREAKEISRENAEASGKKFNDRNEVDSFAAQLLLESWLEQNI